MGHCKTQRAENYWHVDHGAPQPNCASLSSSPHGCICDIRASVDALCRDDPSEISRDTRTNASKLGEKA